ncbi:MAG: Asp-tRNA(Asn)/Glu-tRNA(Gln) amidotransferase subunit GatC [Alphaproteobacteria bacterium]|nr:Asp-tRNA(Asn)/Glu-tRNA(Gln) amidotransferase subunit GatC [Alphaproteobacteria bacterium]
MSIDQETVKRIAFLSRLSVDEDKIEATQDEFNKIMSWIENLNEIDTDHVEPLISVNDIQIKLRKDNVTDGNYREKILQNAPAAEYDYFAVPKVME